MGVFVKYSIGFLLATSLLSLPSYASTAKGGVFSATEEGPSEEVISSAPGYRGQSASESEPPANIVKMDLSNDAPRSRVRAPTQKPKLAPVTATSSASAPETTPLPPPETAQFDAVPVTQTEPMVRRLRLVETLIARYGRAYDYRTHTVVELQAILGQLEAESAQTVELRHRIDSRAQVKASAESFVPPPPPAPSAESDTSIGSEAPPPPNP
jgi:hypothetical protein